MKRLFFFLLASLLSIGFLAGTPTQAQDDGGLPTLDELEEGWNTLLPGGDTICSQGTPYQFHVYPGSSSDVLIYFNGGGACWFGLACSLEVEPVTYVPLADLEPNDPRGLDGLFNLELEENPVRDFTIVFAPYCTGDVHLGGAGETTYEFSAGEEELSTTTYHSGFANGSAVLDWVYDNFESPERVVVAGSSGGAIPSPLYAGLVAEHYPDTPVYQLGDGAGGYFTDAVSIPVSAWDVASILPDWEGFEGETNETLRFGDLYIASGTRFDNLTLAQYNTAEDEVQYTFLGLLDITDTPLPNLLEGTYSTIGAEVEDFVSYTAGGPVHTILRSPLMYAYEVDGVRFVDWFAAYISGEEVETVICDSEAGECAESPVELEMEMEGEG
jgi:hypothetical protein